MTEHDKVVNARNAALAAGRVFHATLHAYEDQLGGGKEGSPQAAERQFAQDLKEEVVDILERLVARREREGDRR